MGLNMSKLVKKTYVVSEGVQTDLSIQTYNEISDPKLFITPPKDIHHLCDPRSVSKGIIRTPIVCKNHPTAQFPDNTVKKPYLETNLDDLLPYDSMDCLIKFNDNHSEDASCYGKFNESSTSSCEMNRITDNKYEDSDKSLSCKINILDKEELIEIKELVTVSPNDNPLLLSEPLKEIQNKNLHCQIPIHDSKTVQEVCQQILDELLLSNSNCDIDNVYETKDEVFKDESTSEIIKSMENLCLDHPLCSHKKTFDSQEININDQRMYTPKTSKVQSKSYNNFAIFSCDEPSWNSGSPKKFCDRKPLGEVNLNTHRNFSISGSTKFNQDLENSPLKTNLPILSSQALQTSKPHRSKWDTENTLLI